jgi:hypothetical protein
MEFRVVAILAVIPGEKIIQDSTSPNLWDVRWCKTPKRWLKSERILVTPNLLKLYGRFLMIVLG